MDLYQVERQGVYRRGSLGIYASVEDAKAAAEAYIASCAVLGYDDGDGYHDFTIERMRLGELHRPDNFECVPSVGVFVARYTADTRGNKYRWVDTP